MFGEFCRLLQKCARRTDVIGRYGGDEFVVLMPESGLMSTRAFSDRVLETIRGRIFCFGTHDIRLSVSIGASISDNVCKLNASSKCRSSPVGHSGRRTLDYHHSE